MDGHQAWAHQNVGGSFLPTSADRSIDRYRVSATPTCVYPFNPHWRSLVPLTPRLLSVVNSFFCTCHVLYATTAAAACCQRNRVSSNLVSALYLFLVQMDVLLAFPLLSNWKLVTNQVWVRPIVEWLIFNFASAAWYIGLVCSTKASLFRETKYWVILNSQPT